MKLRQTKRCVIGLLCIIIVATWVINGCSGTSSSPEDSKKYRALLLPYLQKGFEADHASWTKDGIIVVVTSQKGMQAIPIWKVSGSEVTLLQEIPLSAEIIAQAGCPAANPLQFIFVPLFALSNKGDGLLGATVMCDGLSGGETVWFERRDGNFRFVAEPYAVEIEGSWKKEGLACADNGDCLLMLNQGANAQIPGPSSISVVRWRNGKFDKLLINEQEQDDNRAFNLGAVAVSQEKFLVTATEISADKSSARAYLGTSSDLTPITGFDSYASTTPATLTSSGKFLLGGLKKDSTDVLEIGLDGMLNVLGTKPNDPAVSRLRFALIGKQVLELNQVSRQPNPGSDLVIKLEDKVLPLPAFGIGASAVDMITHQDEVWVVGDQFAKGQLGNIHAPLFIRVTNQDAPESAAPLQNESSDDACSVSSDCFRLHWGIRCSGHFTCNQSKCERVCDLDACGDGKCDFSAGEYMESCQQDCN